MLIQKGLQLLVEDFANDLAKFADLVYYDGPLLSHYINRSNNKNYLFNWVDNDTEYNRWLVIEVTLAHLFDYLTDTRTLHDIINQGYNDKLLIIDTNAAGVFISGKLILASELHPEYTPEFDSYFGIKDVLESIPQYVTLFQNSRTTVKHAEYLEEMRSKAVKFRLEPVGETYGTTLGAADIGSFLQRLTRSFKSYLEVRFSSLFGTRFVADELGKMVNKVLETSGDPRAVFANHGSFEIELAVDVLHLLGVDADIVAWQRQALQEYKRDVFDYDFANSQLPPVNLQYASPEQLRAIYLPIISIANSAQYNVKARTTIVEDYKVLKRVSSQDAKKIVPPKPKTVAEEQLDTELTNVLFELQKGQDPRTLSLSQLRRAVVAVSSGAETTTAISDFRSSDGNTIFLREPIEVVISRVGDFYEARYEPLEINKFGASAKTALDAVENDLRLIYSQYQQKLEDPNGPIGERQGRILRAFNEFMIITSGPI